MRHHPLQVKGNCTVELRNVRSSTSTPLLLAKLANNDPNISSQTVTTHIQSHTMLHNVI